MPNANPKRPDPEMLESLVQYASDGIVVLDESTTVVYINPTAQRMTGWKADDAVGQLCGLVTGCANAGPGGQCHGACAFADLDAIPCVDLQLRTRAGAVLDVNASVATLPSLHGEPRRQALVLRDVTEQKQLAEEQRAVSQRMLETIRRQKRQADLLFRIGRELVSVLDLEQNLQLLVDETRALLRTDLAVLMLLNQRGDQLSLRAWSGHLADETRCLTIRQNKGFVWTMVATGQPAKTENFPHDLEPPPEMHPLMFTERLSSAMGHPLMGRGRPLGVLLVANRRPHTFSEEDSALLAVVANTAALALENRRLYDRVQESAQQAERHRLAAEIHDGLTQSLYGLSLMLENLEAEVPNQSVEELQSGLRRARRVVADSLADTRRIIFDLRTAAVREDVGFISMLEAALRYFRHDSGLETELLLPGGPVPDLTRSDGSQILRMVQEALVNIRKHAGAARVTVSVRLEGEELIITITDDGKGFNLEAARAEGHFGLQMMAERTVALGGQLSVESSPGSGTRVTLGVPLERTDK